MRPTEHLKEAVRRLGKARLNVPTEPKRDEVTPKPTTSPVEKE